MLCKPTQEYNASFSSAGKPAFGLVVPPEVSFLLIFAENVIK